MFDETDMLRENAELQQLLGHYCAAAAPDRDAWQDRLMGMDGVEARDLVRLHGLLLAFGWVEQNTGNTDAIRPGAVPGCYRTTAAGLRAERVARGSLVPGEAEMAAEAEAASSQQREGRKTRPPRSRKAKADDMAA